MIFDADFDHRLDSKGKDPDSHSPTLKAQHKLLWQKPLPDGTFFTLEDEPGKYLIHQSSLGTFHLSSDTISHSLRHQKRMKWLIDQMSPAELDKFQAVGSIIGARILFPGNRIDGKANINASRGFNPRINDRWDLTLECIRLHYANQANPLQKTFERYSDFFRLFIDFEGYVKFFLLEDLVYSDFSSIYFYLPHEENFENSPRPNSVEDYLTYKEKSIAFVKARNQRVKEWVESNLS